MKKLLIFLLLFFALVCLNQRADAAIKVRPYGTIGGTVIELPGATDWDTLKSGGGVQALHETFPNISFGIDLAFIDSYYVLLGGYNYYVNYLNLLGVCEYTYGIMVLQAGLGPYFGVGTNDEIPFGAMFGGGVDIPINEMLAVNLMARFDIIFEKYISGEGVTFMPALMVGLTVKF